MKKHVLAGACRHVPRQGRQAQGTSPAAEPLGGLGETTLEKQALQVLPLPGFFFFLIILILTNCKELWHQTTHPPPTPPRLTQEMELELEMQASPEDLDSPSQTASPTASSRVEECNQPADPGAGGHNAISTSQ